MIALRGYRLVPCLILLAIGCVGPPATSAKEPVTLTLRDWTNRGFPPDLVHYAIPTPPDGGKGLRVVDAVGKPVPVQLVADGTQTSLAFVAAVPPAGSVTFIVRGDGQGPTAPPAVSSAKEGEALVLANGQVAVKVPAPQENTFNTPVAAATLPAPILAFRGPDGQWRGAGSLLLKRQVKKFAVAQTAAGPVFVESRYRLDYDGGGWYEAVVRVTDRAPFAMVREDCDLGIEADTDFWQLDLTAGWTPDAVEHMSVAGQGNGPATFVTLADEEKSKPANIDPGLVAAAGGDLPLRAIHHDSCWGSKFVAYYGVHAAEARKADPAKHPLAIVAPLHKGRWRRANSLPVFVKGGQVRVHFPMAVKQTSWLVEPRSDVSAFSCHEHDPALPPTHGRRVWALVLAPPTITSEQLQGAAGTGNSVRIYYGVVGLDRYKDYVLDWPDSGVKYPRVFTTPEWLAKPPQGELPVIPPGSGRSLQQGIDNILSSISIHHHHTLGDFGGLVAAAESALADPKLPPEERRLLRGRLALLCYLLTEPDVTSAGNGSHHGNPNMGVSRLSDRSNLAALVPDHPMHKTWSEYMGGFLAYKQGTFMAPEGAWLEYGASYHWGHWGQDQGNLALYAKGAVLLPPQPYQYGGPKDPAFPDKNFLRFGAPTNDLPHAWADSNILDARFGTSVDYAWHSTGYPDWWISPGGAAGWAKGVPNMASERDRRILPNLGQEEGGFTWDRQVMFLKSPNAKGANYFVLRDSTQGEGRFASWFSLSLLGRKSNLTVAGQKVSLDTEWPTKLEMVFTDRLNPAFETAEDDLPLALGAYNKPTGTSRDWVGGKEQHVALRLQSGPGQDVAWVLYPRGPSEGAPTATQLAPGVTKIVTGDGTDYVFLATMPLEFTGEGIEFAGTAGAVRVPKSGEPQLVLLRGSKLSFKGKTFSGPAAAEPQVTAEDGKVRFFAPAAEYVKLIHGNVGVRGMGPFDLTFTPEDIIGTVDGDVRTLVTTWPEKIVRPGYWMDGVRWCAGFADEHSLVKGMATPQFGIAFGVSAGKHDVKIAEWEWPAMPPVPPRAKRACLVFSRVACNRRPESVIPLTPRSVVAGGRPARSDSAVS